MNQGWPHRPRVSRETRLLLTTAFVALAALLALARVRYPDRPSAQNPVQPLLTQLAVRSGLEDLAAEIQQLHPRLAPLLVPFPAWAVAPPAAGRTAATALRVGGEVAITLLPPGFAGDGGQVIRVDPASRLALVRVPDTGAPPPVPWNPGDAPEPQYLIAGSASAATLSLQPVFVGSFQSAVSPLWKAIWIVPALGDLVPGSFVFTSDAMLAGLVVNHEGRPAIVQGNELLAEAERLQLPTVDVPAYLGVGVQVLTPAVARATGSASGVVVTWVDPAGPAAGELVAGDVLEMAEGEALPTPLHWESRVARLSAGRTLMVQVRRAGTSRDVALVATTLPAAGVNPRLGLTLRSVAGTGTTVVEVEPGSSAERAGLLPGDVITRVAASDAPTPAVVRRSFMATADGEALLVVLRRGDAYHVAALEK